MDTTCKTLLVLLTLFFFFSCFFYLATPLEFLVGGHDGWEVPKKDEDVYNHWASKNRFNVNDTVHFKYKKDSVMVVTKEEYKKCRSSQPSFFSNNGDTVYELDRPGLFYFISGVTGHCDRGQKMIIKVLEPASPPQSGNDTSPPKSGGHRSAPTSTALPMLATLCFVVLLLV